MKTSDGLAVRRGRLIRSGQLGKASKADAEWLRNNVSLVMDFRTEKECAESPDPVLEGVDYIHVPIIDSLAAGVSRDAESDEQAFMMLINNPDGAMDYMRRTYESFIASETANRGYELFVRRLLDGEEKAILWHCTAGKDRTGFASVILLEILGADRDLIIQDYLATNRFIEPDVQEMISFFFRRTGAETPESEQAMRNLFCAREEYINAAYAKIEEMHGDFTGYMRNALNLGPQDIERMRTMYLTEK